MPSPVNINIIQRVENVCRMLSNISNKRLRWKYKTCTEILTMFTCLQDWNCVLGREREGQSGGKRYLLRIMKQRDGYAFMFFYVNTPYLRIGVDSDTFLGFLAEGWNHGVRIFYISFPHWRGEECERERERQSEKRVSPNVESLRQKQAGSFICYYY